MVDWKVKFGILLLLWWIGLMGATAGEPSQHQAGFYIIAAEAPSVAALPAPTTDQQVVRYDQKFLRDPDAQPRYLLMPKRPDVTLMLAKPPELGKSANGFAELQLELTAEAAGNLEKVSRENLGKTVAFVVDGEPVTIHKIRSVITGGQFKLSRCTDNACQFIYGRRSLR